MKKILSRKFLLAIAGAAVGIAMIFGIDADTIATVAGAVMTIGSVLTYIITEGRVDAASVSKVAESVGTVVNAMNGVMVDEVELIAAECPKIIIPSDEGDEPDEADEMADKEDDNSGENL